MITVGLLTGVGASYTTAIIVEHTKDDQFCATCHTMQPMINSYHADVHGGKNPEGIKVNCLGCHAPHDSLLNYLFTKATTGTHDAIAEVFYDKSKIDWEAKRKHAKDFVYDSGCMSCHTNLRQATQSNHRAFIAHKDYFLKRTTKTCVACHSNVGHFELSKYLTLSKQSNQ